MLHFLLFIFIFARRTIEIKIIIICITILQQRPVAVIWFTINISLIFSQSLESNTEPCQSNLNLHVCIFYYITLSDIWIALNKAQFSESLQQENIYTALRSIFEIYFSYRRAQLILFAIIFACRISWIDWNDDHFCCFFVIVIAVHL